jgi:hypothetical protein
MEDQGLQTHLWVGNHSRQIEIDGKLVVLYRCPRCSRNFAREPDQPDWKAALVGPFRIELLPQSVSQQWVSEPCPGPPPASPLESAARPASEVEQISQPAPGRHRLNRKIRNL